jgi:hypothetical protein
VYFTIVSPFSLCVEVDTSSHGWTVRLSQPDLLLEHRIVRAQVSDRLRCSSQGTLLGSSIQPAPAASKLFSLLVRSLSSDPSLWYIRRARITNDMFFPLPLSVTLGRTKIFLLASSTILTENGCVSTCISWKINQPSFMPDCICLRKTLQSLVAWKRSYATCN